MAEGGEGSGEDNPFSFKKFVNNRRNGDSPTENDTEENNESVGLPDLRPDIQKQDNLASSNGNIIMFLSHFATVAVFLSAVGGREHDTC